MIVLIQCCKSKLLNRNEAKDIYISPLFRLSLQYAQSLNPQAIHILSARYGLLELNSIIDHYDNTLLNMSRLDRKEWAARIIYDLQNKYDLRKDIFIILAGIRYREFLIPMIYNYEIPLAGLSIGRQLSQLKRFLIQIRPKKGFWI
jgi:hypothetical protein